jgi:hypothetical protein
MKKAFSFVVAVGLALAGIPVGAQDLPNSIKGSVPAGIEGVANAVLQDASGKNLSMVPVTDGKFTFRNVAAGEYYVGLFSVSGQRIARSCSLTLAIGAAKETSFDCPVPVAAVPPPTAAATTTAVAHSGIGRTGWIVIGAAAVGITTAVVIATNNDEGVASPVR